MNMGMNGNPKNLMGGIMGMGGNNPNNMFGGVGGGFPNQVGPK